jgi:hypothetical protein
MMDAAMLQEKLERIDTLSIIQIAAFVCQLNIWLRSDDCTDEDRKNGLKVLGRLTERVRFLETSSSPVFSRT